MKIITVCGSIKFSKEIKEITEKLTLEGNIVLSPIELTKRIDDYSKEDIQLLGKVHKEKIKISDEVFIVNVNGYIGDSTKSEIEYAKSMNKKINYYEGVKI